MVNKLKENSLNVTKLFIAVVFISIYYFILFLYIYNKKNILPDTDIFFIQLSSILLYFCIPVFFQIRQDQLHYVIFIIQFIFGTFLFTYYYIHNIPYGFDAVDAFSYEKIANESKDLSIIQFIKTLNKKYDLSISDYGFPFIRYLIAQITKNTTIQNYLLVILNSILISFSSKILGLLANNFLNQENTKALILFWGLNPFSIYTSPSGMKENVFIFIIIITFYFLQKYYSYNKKKYLFLFFTFLILTFFFRWFITIFILTVFLFKKLYQSTALNKFLPLIFIGLPLIGLFFASFINFLGINNNPFINTALAVQEYRAGGTEGYIANFISSWVGPFPSIIYVSQKAPLIYAIGNLIKMVLSFYFIFGIYFVYKYKIKKLYPIVLYIIFNIFLVVVSNTALDMRFQYTMLPFYLMLSFFGIQYYNKKTILLPLSYLIFIVTPIIIFYNFR